MAGLENPRMLSLLLLLLPAAYLLFKKRTDYGRNVTLIRTAMIAILVIAAASPFITAKEEVRDQPEIVLLKDSSTSSKLIKDIETEFGEIKLREKVIASGNSSDLRHGILRNLEPNTAYLAISDFRSTSSLKGIGEKFLEKNSTLSAMRPEMKKDASVTIKGPDSTVPGAKNSFSIKVHSTSEVPEPELQLDGKKVELSQKEKGVWTFNKRFSNKGSHRLKASIKTRDRFEQNNIYFHAVEVTEKPEILVLGSKGSIGENLEKFYSVDHRQTLPEDLSKYYTIIMKKQPEREPISYVSRGNGIVYTGDYEKEMDILPLKKAPKEDQSSGAKIVLGIDISTSTSESGSIKRSKQIAYNLVEKLPYNNRVGAVAYNRDAYVVSKPEPLSQSRDELKRKISRLQPSGPSLHQNGVKGAEKVLNGTGNIILITDGRIGGLGQNTNVPAKTRRAASDLNVQLITVGVGNNANRDFLEDIARRGNGFYLDAKESGRLKFQFRAGGASGQNTPLVIINPNHFVTEDLKLDSAASFFDSVKPRTGSQLLVAGTGGQPFLATWRYGIGRVAAFSGGDTDLSQVSAVDPKLLTRTVSWTAGDPKRKKDEWIKVENSRRPEKAEIKASYPANGLKRQGEDLYTAERKPADTGFYSFNGKTYGYNYNREIQEIGYSEEMKEIVRAAGGEVYKPNEKEQIVEELKRFSEKKVVTKKPLSGYLLALALMVFLAEIAYRKMNGRK